MFLFKKTCRHEHFLASAKTGYCPDCGEYVENRWFITKCPVCGKRHKTIIKNGKPMPVDKFCTNCGCQEFKVEEIDMPDIVTINYAVYITETVKQNQSNVRIWVENANKIDFLTLVPV